MQSADPVQIRASVCLEIVDKLTLYGLSLYWIRHGLSSNRCFNASKKFESQNKRVVHNFSSSNRNVMGSSQIILISLILGTATCLIFT